MASHSHSGGPTAFRQNRSTAMTLSRPLRLTPHWASPGWPRVYQRHPDHRRGQLPLGDTPTRGLVPKISKTSTQGYVRLPDQGKHAHNLPSLEAPARGTTIDRIKAFPQRQMWLHWEKLDSAAPWLSQQLFKFNLIRLTWMQICRAMIKYMNMISTSSWGYHITIHQINNKSYPLSMAYWLAWTSQVHTSQKHSMTTSINNKYLAIT